MCFSRFATYHRCLRALRCGRSSSSVNFLRDRLGAGDSGIEAGDSGVEDSEVWAVVFILNIYTKIFLNRELRAWYNLSAFIKSDGIDAQAYEYIKRNKLVKRSGI